MTILALDCATNCGFAWGQDGIIQSAGVKTFALPRGASPGMRWIMFGAWIRGEIDIYKPKVVVYEQPFIAGMRSGTVAEIAYGMTTRVQEACSERDVEYRPVANSVIKQYATGAGNAKKDAVKAAAAKEWPNYDLTKDPGGDEADARFLCAYAMDGFPAMESATDRKTRERREFKERTSAAATEFLRGRILSLLVSGSLEPWKVTHIHGGLTAEAQRNGASAPSLATVKGLLVKLEAEGLACREGRGWKLAAAPASGSDGQRGATQAEQARWQAAIAAEMALEPVLTNPKTPERIAWEEASMSGFTAEDVCGDE